MSVLERERQNARELNQCLFEREEERCVACSVVLGAQNYTCSPNSSLTVVRDVIRRLKRHVRTAMMVQSGLEQQKQKKKKKLTFHHVQLCYDTFNEKLFNTQMQSFLNDLFKHWSLQFGFQTKVVRLSHLKKCSQFELVTLKVLFSIQM